jgi:hypothetical protein
VTAVQGRDLKGIADFSREEIEITPEVSKLLNRERLESAAQHAHIPLINASCPVETLARLGIQRYARLA